MTWPTATLTGGNYTSLRSTTYRGAGYACLCPNTVVWSTTLAATATGTTNAVVAYGATITGNAADVQIGHRVLIGTANDIRKATFSGRIRTVPGGGLLGINETSASLTNGMYVWVVDDYPLLDKLARPVGNPPVQYKDFDLIYEGLKPVVVGVQFAYAGFINASNVLRIAFDASTSYAAESGATISSYQFTFKAASYTVISGALNTSAATVDFNEGFQWGKLVVTDSGGRTQTRHFMIFACGSTTTPALSFQGASITGNLDQGWSANSEAFADVSSVLNNTPVVFWTQEYYGGTEGPINNNVDMVGWLRTETDPADSDPNYSLILSSQFEVTGIGTKLARLEAQLLALSNVASPTLWDEIKNLTPWRGLVHFLQRHTTLLELVDLTFGGTTAETDNTFLFPYLTTQGGNVLAAVNGIASQINASMEFAPDGAVRVVRDARFLTSSQRNALVTYANWTSSDYSSISEQYTHEQGLGKVDADGAFYDATSTNVTAFRARAPGLAQDSGPDTVNINNQILAASVAAATAQGELNQRAGDQYEISSNPSYILQANHPDGYHFLLPSRQLWYTWTLAAGTDNIRGISYTTSNRWQLENISIAIDNNIGVRTVQASYRLETPIGNAGTSIIIEPAGSIDLALPAFPPFDPFPNFPDLGILDGIAASALPPYTGTGMTGVPGHHIIAPRDGNTVMTWTATKVWTSRSFAARSSPVWTDVTPDTLVSVADCKFTPSGQGGYILGSASGSANWTQSFDFLTSNGGFTALIPGPGYAPVAGTYVGGTGWQANYSDNGSDAFNELFLSITLGGSATFTGMQIVYDRVIGVSHVTNQAKFYGYLSGVLVFTAGSSPGPEGTGVTFTWSGSQVIDEVRIDLNNGHCNPPVCAPGGSATLLSATFTGTGTNPFGGGSGQNVWYTPDLFTSPVEWTQGTPIGAGTYTVLCATSTDGDVLIYNPSGADIRLSTNNGILFGSTVSVGTTPGAAGGFDVSRVGNTSVGAASAKARKATTLGGAYSDHTAYVGTYPLTLYIPRLKFGGTTTNASLTDPDYLAVTAALTGGDSVFKVSGGVQTAITPSVAGTKALAVGPQAANMGYLNGNFIALIASISGTAHLFTSTDATNWTDRGAVSGALAARIRKSDLRSVPALFLSGGTILKYSSNGGAALSDRTKPASGGLQGIEVLG